MDVIHQRSQFHVDVLQPVVERVEAAHGAMVDPAIIDAALGTRRLRVLVTLSDYMIQGVDDVLSGTGSKIAELAALGKSIYPSHSFLKMALVSEARKPGIVQSK
jgi:hypothetical protein